MFFTRSATRETAFFADIRLKKVGNLIIDIRNNGGGESANASSLYSCLTDKPFRFLYITMILHYRLYLTRPYKAVTDRCIAPGYNPKKSFQSALAGVDADAAYALKLIKGK